MRKTILWFISFTFLFLYACNALPGRDTTGQSDTGTDSPAITESNEPTQESSAISDSSNSSDSGSSRPTASGSSVSASSDSASKAPASSEFSDSTSASTTTKNHGNPGSAAPSQSAASVDPSTLSNTLMAWWFMRTEDHTQPSAQEEIDLNRYDAYYVKKNLKEGEKPVFLTFDCGYENGYTPAILDVLKKHKAPAAFFVCRHFIEDQPELIKRMKKEGHIVGNHTANHICMPEADERTIRKEIADNASFMKETTGYDMDYFFRPPKGEYSERTLQITKDMGYTTVFWSMAYVDYDVDNQPGAQYVIDHFNEYIHPGAVPLIHNISQSNAEALDAVLTNLEKEGYTFCSLTELR